MAHDHITAECEERFKAVDGQLNALRELAQGTQATVLGNGKPGLVTAQALVAQKLEAVEDRLAAVEGRLMEIAAAPREVRDEMVTAFGRLETQLARIAPAPPPPGASAGDISPSLVRVVMVALGVVGTVLVILAAVLGVDLGGGP